MNQSISYADAGVSIDAGAEAKDRIKRLARETFGARVLSEIGSFGGMFDASFPDMRSPVLVASADGVGTKLKIAFLAGTHDTIGLDLVNHCTNDILVQGARPLFFLDYIATGKLAPDVIASVVEGVARGCRENSCALLGGETAEMPGFYAEGEYDIAGFIVGIVDREKIIDGQTIEAGDRVLGLASSGLHTNGYSLARKLFFEIAGHTADTHLDRLGETIGAALLAPHKSYLRAMKPLLEKSLIKGMAHITGGGLLENIPRILPEGAGVEIRRGSWPVLEIFRAMQEIGNVTEAEMHRTFNMGIGMAVICEAQDTDALLSHFAACGEACYEIGRVVEGAREVKLI